MAEPPAATPFACRLEGQPAEALIGPDALIVGTRPFAYVDLDEIRVEGHTITLAPFGEPPAVLSHLARNHDDFVGRFRAARASARRAALLQWTGDPPIDSYDSHDDEEPTTIVLFADGLTVEPLNGQPTFVPLSLITDVARDGHRITLRLRVGSDVVISKLGQRTDEFVLDLRTAVAELAVRTGEAYATLDPNLQGFTAPDGWALTAADAGAYWGVVRGVLAAGDRGAQVDVLERLAGAGNLRIGIKASVNGSSFPFALAPAAGKVAVEGAGDEARATFVFATDDVDRLNAVLLLTSFRREALSLPDDQLGRWAVAARTLDVVKWARKALVARVVHDANWEPKVAEALS